MTNLRERLRLAAPAVIALVLFVGALEILRHELATYSWATIAADLSHTPSWQIAAAVGLTVLNYVVLTGYDFLAFASIGRQLAAWRIALVSFVAYAIANNVGFAMLSGTSVRYRFYTRWGLTAEDLSRIVLSYLITFWLGLLALGGLSLALGPLAHAGALPGAVFAAPVGWLLFAVSLMFVAATMVRRTPIRVWKFNLMLPTPRIAAAQWVVSSLDWILAGTVLYVLLPDHSAPFLAVISAFLAAQLLGLLSHVPGGAGVFEGLIVLLLKPYLSSAELVAPLLLYRGIYYLFPLSVALVALLGDEARQQRAGAARTAALIGRVTEQLTPRILSALTFCAGIVLLFSGATPAAEGRLLWLNGVVPLGIVETSHFAGSLVGAGLLVLSQGVARRIDAAYHLTTIAIGIGIGTALLKGADIEEAILLTVFLFFLRRARPAFDRRASLFETRFSPAWIAAVVAVLTASVWLGLFAFKHVEYSRELWWQFELSAEAPRFLRATIGASIVILLAVVASVSKVRPTEITPPTGNEERA